MSGKLSHIKFITAISYNSLEKSFISLAEQPLCVVTVTKEGVTIVDRTHEIKIPMSNVAYIVYHKE